MISSHAQALRRTALRLGMIFMMVVPIGGCFRPVYSPTANIVPREELQHIQVEPVPEMFGYYLTNELRFLLNGTGETKTPRYRLIMQVVSSRPGAVVDTTTGRATATSVFSRADYQLMPIGAGSNAKPVATGFAITLTQYDRYSNRFANVRAARDAYIRNAKDLAEQLRGHIATQLPLSPAP